MARIEMVMPKMGESIMEGTILNWLKQPGDKIEQDESVLEVATDKVDTEVPASHAGILKEILAEKGQVVQVGKAIAIIETEQEETTAPATVPSTVISESATLQAQAVEAKNQTAEAVKEPIEASRKTEKSAEGRFYSPLVINIAREENISMSELDTINGTGKDGRVTKNDILNYLPNRHKQETTVAPTKIYPKEPQPVDKPAVSVSGNVEIIEMDRMRKLIAERMVESKRTAPHVTSFVEADVTNIVYWRNRIKHEFSEKENTTITFTPIFIEAVVKALKDYPMMNISVEGDKIIKKKDINIGMAVALPSGNLIVPVIKNADRLNLIGLTKAVNDLAKRARDNRLSPDELQGGTYTISNVGSFGNVMGTPIIVQPQVGILALGAVVKKPAVIETPQGDAIGIRHMMFMSHSYDHRVVDGSLGGMFVRRVADYLEGFELNRKVFS